MKKQNNLKPGIYQHSKSGNHYRVLGVVKHSESLEDLVLYEALYNNPRSKLWVRPLQMFMEEVEINGQKLPRFILIEEDER